MICYRYFMLAIIVYRDKFVRKDFIIAVALEMNKGGSYDLS